MLVNSRMSAPVITVEPNLPVMDAMELMKKRKIRRTPVVEDGRMIGIVSVKDLLDASPSEATSLSVWELNYLIGRIGVAEVMTRQVITVHEDTPVEEAATLMVEQKIGGLPVVAGPRLVGLITETDLFKIFVEMLGGGQEGVRVTALVPAGRGVLDGLSHAVAGAGGEFLAYGQFAGNSLRNRMVTFKVTGLGENVVKEQITGHIEELVDIRTCCD